MCSSALSLCPRGHGLASFRFYESIAVGAVPVVSSDLWSIPSALSLGVDYFDLPERKLLDEQNCIRVLEKHTSHKYVKPTFLESHKFDRICDQIMSVDIDADFDVDHMVSTTARIYRALYEKCSHFIVSRI
jgi:hypothetical protein